MLAGSCTIPAGLAVSAMLVAASWAAFTASVRLPAAPGCRSNAAGSSETSASGWGMTLTVACWLLPFKLAVSCACPTARACT